MAEDHPIHPKLLGGLAGVGAGGGLGAAIVGILSRIHQYAGLDATTKQYIAGLLIAGFAAIGQVLLAYVARWEPKAAAEAGTVIHVLDPDLTQVQIEQAVNRAWTKTQAEASKVMQSWTQPTPPEAVPSKLWVAPRTDAPSSPTVQVTANPGPTPSPTPTPAAIPQTSVAIQDTPAHPTPEPETSESDTEPAPEPTQATEPASTETTETADPLDESSIPDSIPIPDED